MILLILLGLTHSSFAGLTELFQFEDDNYGACYNIRHGGSAFPEAQKEARREAIRSLIQSMSPERSNVFIDQILAIERRGLFYLNIEQIAQFSKKSPRDRANIVKHVDKRVRNYMCNSSFRGSECLCLCLEEREQIKVKREELENWESFLNPLLDHRQMNRKGPEAECLNRIFGRKGRYTSDLLNALGEIPSDQQENVIRQVLSLESDNHPLDFGPNLIHLQPFVEILGSLSPAEREDVITQVRKISRRSGYRDEVRNLALDLTVLTFLSRVDPSERESLMEVIESLCGSTVVIFVSADNNMFDDIFEGIHSKSLGALWHQRSIHWDSQEQLQAVVRYARAFLMELRHLNFDPVKYSGIKYKAQVVAKIKYASRNDEEWFREGHRPDLGFLCESDAYRFEHRPRCKSLSEADRERDYSLAAREEQIAIFNRIVEVFPDHNQQYKAVNGFSETAMTRQTQTRFLDLFLPTMTLDQRAEILSAAYGDYASYTSEGWARIYRYINNAWQETREVFDPAERVRVINRIFHPVHAELQAQGIVDRENVMNERRIARSKAALEALYTDLTPGFNLQRQYPDIISAIEAYIQGLKLSERTSPRDPLFYGTRAGNTEIGHALFVLNGVKNAARGDYDSLAENNLYTHSDSGQPYRMLGILGRVWHLINSHENEAERTNMLHSFVMALGQSFDEDGGRGPHRVCNIGKVQRLLSVLQGHFPGIEIDDVEEIPAIESVLTTLTSELFNAEDHSPKVTLEQARALIAETAERVYGRNAEQRTAFLAQAENFLDALSPVEEDAAFGASDAFPPSIPPVEQASAIGTSDALPLSVDALPPPVPPVEEVSSRHVHRVGALAEALARIEKGK